eukprot:gnl/TRDRNA2_/TRDRNA2_62842_c0_seq1.p1 gnl/TRDRNA2_/TRDRNA2_62842_c0~~gnl/TRDRNA2_/TRDRNA2_62842_c0_seq1.p1  ORF type:complete len:248 (+),score=28.26 gnl/TRDRNA2_/TRDRNA2_62842_c0_seq1:2-745(+)
MHGETCAEPQASELDCLRPDAGRNLDGSVDVEQTNMAARKNALVICTVEANRSSADRDDAVPQHENQNSRPLHANIFDGLRCRVFLEDGTVVQYLAAFGYSAEGPYTWTSSRMNPQLHITLKGHEILDLHRVYNLDVSLKLEGAGQVKWLAPRRLKELKEGWHGPMKELIGQENYSAIFGETPFARMGGVPGTSSRLTNWCASFTHATNELRLPPLQVARTLKFIHDGRRREVVVTPSGSGGTLATD